jgi:hypothetical protein
MRRLQVAAVLGLVVIVLVLVAAAVLRPYLPWLVALVIMGGILRIASR